ncbi:hypothetical protein [Streptomyces aureus]|uniref:Uncharacterized protein n=1 Tax=Streptomyces aureus TaxID=193461 RepID=A0ABV4SKT0_9ACTN
MAKPANSDAQSHVQAQRDWIRTYNALAEAPTGSKQVFGRNLQSAIPQLTLTRPRDGESRVRTYTGITVRPVAGAAD